MIFTRSPLCVCACVRVFPIYGYLGWRCEASSFLRRTQCHAQGKGHVNNCPSKSNHRNDDRKQEFPLFVLNPHFYFFSSVCKSSFLVPHAGHSTSPPRQSLRQFPHNWFTVFCDHLSYIICTHRKKKPKFKLLKKHSLPSFSGDDHSQKRREESWVYKSVQSSGEGFHDLLYSAVTQLPLVTHPSRRYLLCFCAMDKDAFYQFSEVCRTHRSCCQLPQSPFSK